MPRYFQAASLLAGFALSCLVNAASFASAIDDTSVPSITAASAATATPDEHKRMAEAYGKLPLSFEANLGQTHSSVKFFSRGPGYRLFLTQQEAVLSLAGSPSQRDIARSPTIRLRFAGANPAPNIIGESPAQAKSHYLIGPNAAQQVTDVPHYAQVRYAQMYPGIDLVFYGNQQDLEYDIVAAPGADLSAVKMMIAGTDKIDVNAQGDLILHTSAGEVAQHRPVAYQVLDDGERAPVDAEYTVIAANEIGFRVGRYDKTRPIVIDPVLTYSTFFGGSSLERIYAVKVDGAGNTYVTGTTMSANFPLVNQYDRSLESGGYDAFVAKLNAAGTALSYSTYLGGRNGNETGQGIAIDNTGNAYITGHGVGSDFPVTTGAVRMAGGTGFVTKLNAQGKELVYSSIISALPKDIAVDTGGNAYITGFDQAGFVTTSGAYRQNKPGVISTSDAIVTKLNAIGTLAYSTYLGGSQGSVGNGVAIDASDNAYVIGQTSSSDFPVANQLETAPPAGKSTSFITKLNAAGNALVYSTYLGGMNGAEGYAIAVDGNGFAYVTGKARAGFPLRNAMQPVLSGGSDAFVMKLNQAGNDFVYSTYLGGAGDDNGWTHGIAVDRDGNAYVSGFTYSNDFPLRNPIQTIKKNAASAGTGFIAKLSQTGLPLYSTYLGGSDSFGGDIPTGIAVDSQGSIYVAGYTHSTDFPVTPGSLKVSFSGITTQGFIAKLSTAQIDVTLASSAKIIEAGQSITLTATATRKSGTGALTGTIAFVDGQNTLATAPLVNGGASASVTLPAGLHTLTAIYSESNDSTASPPFYQTVNPPVCNE